MNNFTLNGHEYDLLLQDGDIILQSLDHDLTFVGGWDECKEDARDYCKANAFDFYGRWVGYSESQVYDIALTYIADYIKTEVYTILKHENN